MTCEQLEVADILKSFLLSSFRFSVFVPFFQRKSCKPSYQISAQDRIHTNGRGGGVEQRAEGSCLTSTGLFALV